MTPKPEGTRRARVLGKGVSRSRVATYLPSNYTVVGMDDTAVLIEGVDVAGWTLDDYVIPRLASGLLWAQEVRS